MKLLRRTHRSRRLDIKADQSHTGPKSLRSTNKAQKCTEVAELMKNVVSHMFHCAAASCRAKHCVPPDSKEKKAIVRAW